MGLVVAGYEPLSVKWNVHSGIGRWGKLETLEGIRKGEKDGAGADVINVPLNVDLGEPGTKKYSIETVVDGCGNEVSYSLEESEEKGEVAALATKLLPGTFESRTIVVHSLPEVAFAGACGRGEDVRLLQGSKAVLELKLGGVGTDVAEERRANGGTTGQQPLWKIAVRFTPETGKPAWTRDIETSETSLRIEAEESGLYEIVGITGKWCEGVILVPSTVSTFTIPLPFSLPTKWDLFLLQCTVISQPLPTLSVSFEPLLDVCSSEVGVISTLLLTGAPPFIVHYVLTQLSPVVRSTRKQQRITHSREEIRLEPGPGEWKYSFLRLEDAFYKDIDLSHNESFKRKQTVQLVGGAQWKNAEQGKKVHSCDGETVSVEVELKVSGTLHLPESVLTKFALQGKSPWEIEYSVVGSPTQVISNINTPTHKFDIAIPAQIAQRGGQFSLSLRKFLSSRSLYAVESPLTFHLLQTESVKDGNGCRRPLTASDLVIDVRRTKPTARFHGAGSARSITIKENDKVKIPLRLTGEGVSPLFKIDDCSLLPHANCLSI